MALRGHWPSLASISTPIEWSWTRVGKECWERILGLVGEDRAGSTRGSKASRIWGKSQWKPEGPEEWGSSGREGSWYVCLFESTPYVI